MGNAPPLRERIGSASRSNPNAFGHSLVGRFPEGRANPRHTMSPTIQVPAIHAEAPVSDAARFMVGQDPEGHCVAIEIHGRAGGLFRSRKAAVDYVEDETDHRPDAQSCRGSASSCASEAR